MSTKQKAFTPLPYLMVLPAFAVMALVVMLPIFNTVANSFTTAEGAFTLENYTFFLESPEAWSSLVYTMLIAIIVTVLSILGSFLLALYLRFSQSPISRLLGKMYLLPRFIPGIAAVYAVMNIIKDAGFLNRLALVFGIDYKPGLLYDIKGIIIVNLWFSIPFSAMLLSAALSVVSDSHIESARDAGCGSIGILCKIILPLVYKDIVVSATFIMMGQIGGFTIPYMTGPNNPKVLGVLLYQQTGLYLNYEHAAAMSVLMFLLCLAGAVVYIHSNIRDAVWETGGQKKAEK